MTDLYLGRWTLVPELCLYDDGAPPEHATYELRRDGGSLRVRMTWRAAGQSADQTTEFAGPESGEVQPVVSVPGVTGLSITRVDERTLDSAAWRDTSVVSSARRVASADGDLLAVRQALVREDGGAVRSFQVYRRARDWPSSTPPNRRSSQRRAGAALHRLLGPATRSASALRRVHRMLHAVQLPWRQAPSMHMVTVHDVRPLEGERHAFEPYFVALCTCDAYPKVRNRKSEALEDAQQHAVQTGGHVEPEVRRPVG